MFNKRSLLLALFLLTNIVLHAQFSAGLRTGVHFSTAEASDGIDALPADLRIRDGFTIGVTGEYAFHDNFALQTELNYLPKGFKLDATYDVSAFGVSVPIGTKALIKSNYIELPLLAKARFGTERARFYAAAGPSVGYLTSAKLVIDPIVFIPLDPIKVDLDADAIGLERWDVSAVGAVGGEFRIGGPVLQLEARYYHGFTELYDFPIVNETLKNRGVSLTLGFKVPF